MNRLSRIRFLSQLALLAVFLATAIPAQVVTPRRKVAAVYKSPEMESEIVAEVEPNGRWRLDFAGAEIPAQFPEETQGGAEMKFLLPGRDNGAALMARVKGPGKRNEGWVDPEKVDISPEPGWKIPTSTILFVPLRAKQLPPLRSGSVPRTAAGSWLLLVNPEGKVAGLRPLTDQPAAGEAAAVEAALRQFRFAPMRFEGEEVHVVVAVKLYPSRR